MQSDLGNYEDAVVKCEEALSLFSIIRRNKDHEDVVNALRRLGYIYGRRGNKDKARECLNQFLVSAPLGGTQDHNNTPNDIKVRSAPIQGASIKSGKTTTSFMRSYNELQRQAEIYRKIDVNDAQECDRLASVYELKISGAFATEYGNLEEAIDNYEEALALIESSSSSEFKMETRCQILRDLGLAFMGCGYYKKAIFDNFEKARSELGTMRTTEWSPSFDTFCTKKIEELRPKLRATAAEWLAAQLAAQKLTHKRLVAALVIVSLLGIMAALMTFLQTPNVEELGPS